MKSKIKSMAQFILLNSLLASAFAQSTLLSKSLDLFL